MGQFSWLDCKDGSQILDNVKEKVYLLVPEDFGGGHIEETYYDGYGNFGGFDVYDLVAEWNRKFIADNPYFVTRAAGCIGNRPYYKAYSDLDRTRTEVVVAANKLDSDGPNLEWRDIGIDIACYDVDNERLPYPIKVTHDGNAKYEDCGFSPSDPDQGWMSISLSDFPEEESPDEW